MDESQGSGAILMNTPIGILPAALAAAAVLAAPLALGANTKPDAFMQKAIEGNLAEIKVGQLARTYQRLASLSGKSFDKAFLEAMVKDHKKDIAEFKKESKTSNSAAANYAQAVLPDLHKHLQLAESLERHPSG